MQTIVLAGLLVLFGVCLAVGVKLLLLARRTRAFPEFALGFFFLVGAGIGYPLSGVAPFTGDWEPILAILSTLFVGVATVMLYAFTARVFRAGQRAEWVGLGVGAALALVYIFGYASLHLSSPTEEEMLHGTMVWGGVSIVMSLGSFGWTGVESTRHYLRHRQRLALGLADPVVTNRMLLWGLMGLTTCGIVLIDAGLLFSGSVYAREILIPLVTSMGGVVFGAFLMLAFFPPASYLRVVRRRAGHLQEAR